MKSIFTICMTAIASMACTKKESTDYPPAPTEPVQKRVLKQSLPYLDQQGVTHRYTLSLPEAYNEQGTLPVVMYLHGKGGDENSDLGSAHYIDNILKECNAPYPLLVFPSNANNLHLLDQNYHIAFGLLDEIANNYDIADISKRVIMGFSRGASSAYRTPIINPGSYSLSVNWAGWVWRKDEAMFNAVNTHAEQLLAIPYKTIFFVGDEDNPNAYEPLIPLLSEKNISHELTILDNQQHNLATYHQRTRESLKAELCQLFGE